MSKVFVTLLYACMFWRGSNGGRGHQLKKALLNIRDDGLGYQLLKVSHLHLFLSMGRIFRKKSDRENVILAKKKVINF